MWPDFATMTALENLRLRYCTSLEWLVLPSTLISLQMRGCTQLPAEEFMKVITLKMQPRPNRRCILAVISSLRDDLKDQTRVSISCMLSVISLVVNSPCHWSWLNLHMYFMVISPGQLLNCGCSRLTPARPWSSFS